VYDRDAFERAHVRLRNAPGELTMGDIEQLTAFSVDLGREAVAARKAALFADLAPRTLAATHGPIARKNALSPESVDSIAEAVVWFVKEQFQQQLSPLLRRLDALEQQPPSPHYQGVFQEEKTYSRGSMVTKAGGLWLALEDTRHVPGRSDQWKLIVKSGEALR
jgi:hypothetical protein